MNRRRALTVVMSASLAAVSLAACGGSGGSGSTSSGVGKPWIMGTTDTVTALDPSGAYDIGSWTLEYNLYQTPLTIPAGQNKPEGDAAKSCTYTDPKTLKCTMKSGLTFSNGDPLTSEDVKYSVDRSIKIKDPVSSVSVLFSSVKSVAAPDPSTVIFHLKVPDQTFQYVLTTPAAAIVDHKVFADNKLLPDSQVIGSGPYTLAQYKPGQQAVFKANASYNGPNKPQSPEIFVQYFKESSALKLAVQSGQVQVAWRSLSPTDITSLKSDSKVTVAEGQGGEIRYWVWRTQDGPGKSVAVRQAAAMLIDRSAIATKAYSNTVTPLYSIVPPGLAGANQAFKTKYGASPNVSGAKKLLQQAGVKTPVPITLGYTPSHYGPNAVDEASEFQRELQASGLFKVSLKSAEWTQYQSLEKQGAYNLFQLGWFPDYLDADDYLAPFMVDGGFFANGYKSTKVDNLVNAERAQTNVPKREALFGQLQDQAATDVPFIPSWVGKNIAVYGQGVSGVESTLDPSFIFRLWKITFSG
ncbi:MAG: ABC transporter substrate-binding protein [Nocardioidaceae bacterium]